MKVAQADYEKALEELRKVFPQGSTVYTILRQVSRSGMSRQIGVIALTDDGPLFPTWWTSQALGLPMNGRYGDGVKIRGCGTDMGFEIAYRLGRVLYGDGYALKHRWL